MPIQCQFYKRRDGQSFVLTMVNDDGGAQKHYEYTNTTIATLAEDYAPADPNNDIAYGKRFNVTAFLVDDTQPDQHLTLINQALTESVLPGSYPTVLKTNAGVGELKTELDKLHPADEIQQAEVRATQIGPDINLHLGADANLECQFYKVGNDFVLGIKNTQGGIRCYKYTAAGIELLQFGYDPGSVHANEYGKPFAVAANQIPKSITDHAPHLNLINEALRNDRQAANIVSAAGSVPTGAELARALSGLRSKEVIDKETADAAAAAAAAVAAAQAVSDTVTQHITGNINLTCQFYKDGNNFVLGVKNNAGVSIYYKYTNSGISLDNTFNPSAARVVEHGKPFDVAATKIPTSTTANADHLVLINAALTKMNGRPFTFPGAGSPSNINLMSALDDLDKQAARVEIGSTYLFSSPRVKKWAEKISGAFAGEKIKGHFAFYKDGTVGFAKPFQQPAAPVYYKVGSWTEIIDGNKTIKLHLTKDPDKVFTGTPITEVPDFESPKTHTYGYAKIKFDTPIDAAHMTALGGNAPKFDGEIAFYAGDGQRGFVAFKPTGSSEYYKAGEWEKVAGSTNQITINYAAHLSHPLVRPPLAKFIVPGTKQYQANQSETFTLTGDQTELVDETKKDVSVHAPKRFAMFKNDFNKLSVNLPFKKLSNAQVRELEIGVAESTRAEAKALPPIPGKLGFYKGAGNGKSGILGFQIDGKGPFYYAGHWNVDDNGVVKIKYNWCLSNPINKAPTVGVIDFQYQSGAMVSDLVRDVGVLATNPTIAALKPIEKVAGSGAFMGQVDDDEKGLPRLVPHGDVSVFPRGAALGDVSELTDEDLNGAEPPPRERYWVSRYNQLVFKAARGSEGKPTGNYEIVGRWHRVGNKLILDRTDAQNLHETYKHLPVGMFDAVIAPFKDNRAIPKPGTKLADQIAAGGTTELPKVNYVLFYNGSVAVDLDGNPEKRVCVGTWEHQTGTQKFRIDTSHAARSGAPLPIPAPGKEIGELVLKKMKYEPSDANVVDLEITEKKVADKLVIRRADHERLSPYTSFKNIAAEAAIKNFEEWADKLRSCGYKVYPAFGADKNDPLSYEIRDGRNTYHYHKDRDTFQIKPCYLAQAGSARRAEQMQGLCILQQSKHGKPAGNVKVVTYSGDSGALKELNNAYKEHGIKEDQLQSASTLESFYMIAGGKEPKPNQNVNQQQSDEQKQQPQQRR